MKNLLLFTFITLLFSSHTTVPILTTNFNKCPAIQNGTYTVVVEGYDWGPAASKVILTLDETVSTVQKEAYSISVEKSTDCKELTREEATGERTVLYAYVSNAKGERVEEGNHITLVLLVAPNLAIGSPMMYIPECRGNVWVDYSMMIKDRTTNQVWDKEISRIRPLVDEFDVTGKFVYNSDLTLTYADYTPKTQREKIPLIIWLHGGGEGGTDPTIALMANRATNYASPEIQAYFGGAYVLVPQTPTFWMDNGKGKYTRGDVNDKYNESLMALIEDYVSRHPNIDTDRIYIGGCSNGGYMTLKLLLLHPEYFAAGFPSALAFHAEFLNDAQINSIKNIPIWFIHSKDDTVTKADETAVPVYTRLIKAGAKQVHFSLFDHVVDITGFFGGNNFHYMGHFSWIYSHANLCKLDYDGNPVLLNDKPVTLMEWMAAQRKNR